jgi:hypothetical protein
MPPTGEQEEKPGEPLAMRCRAYRLTERVVDRCCAGDRQELYLAQLGEEHVTVFNDKPVVWSSLDEAFGFCIRGAEARQGDVVELEQNHVEELERENVEEAG